MHRSSKSSRTRHSSYTAPNTSAIGETIVRRLKDAGLFNQWRSCWLRFAPPQYTLYCSAKSSWQTNLAVPPSRNVSLCRETTVADKFLNASGDHMIPRISLGKLRAKSLCCRNDDHRNLPPRRLRNRNNGIINLSRTHTRSRRTFQISDPAPMIFDCKPERHRRVHCIWFVGPLFLFSRFFSRSNCTSA
jgi:hypothetical protein